MAWSLYTYIYIYNHYHLVGGWPTHLEKWWSSSMGRMTSHMKWKITNVWNHQPLDLFIVWSRKKGTFGIRGIIYVHVFFLPMHMLNYPNYLAVQIWKTKIMFCLTGLAEAVLIWLNPIRDSATHWVCCSSFCTDPCYMSRYSSRIIAYMNMVPACSSRVFGWYNFLSL